MINHYSRGAPYAGSEDNLQMATAQIVALHRDLIAFHTPNGGLRNFVVAAKLKRMGTLPGVSDWLILKKTKNFSGACIELKVKKGSLSKPQIEFLERAEKEGYFTAVAWSIEGFQEALLKFLNDK